MSKYLAVIPVLFYRAFLILALIAGSVIPSLSAQDLSLANSIYNQGIEHYADGNYRKATAYLGQIVHMMPDHDLARYYLAYCLSMTGDHDKAIEHARVLAVRYPDHQIYLDLITELTNQKIGVLQQDATSHDDLVSATTSGYEVYTPPVRPPRELRRTPVEKKARTRLERIAEMIEEERYADASGELSTLVAAEPENAEAKYYLGMLHFNQSDYEAAAGHFEDSLKLSSSNFDARFFAGSSYFNRQMLDKAEEHYKKALAIKDDAFVRLNLADIYIRTSRAGESEKMYQQVIDKNPEFTEARVGLALVKLSQGLTEEAAEIVNKVLRDNPSNSRARYARSQILMENRLYSEALEEARAAYESSVGSAEYRANYALAMLRNFQVEAGMSEAQEILNIWPDFVEARLVLAEGLIMSGNTEAAVTQIEVIDAGQHIPQIDYLRATLAAAAGDHEKAKSHWNKYLEGSAGMPSAYLKHAMYLESAGDNVQAMAAYKRIVEKFPESSLAASVQNDIDRLSQAEATVSVTPGPPIPGL